MIVYSDFVHNQSNTQPFSFIFLFIILILSAEITKTQKNTEQFMIIIVKM